jgi:aspartate/methionine/tyrosine aminotransferase
MDFPERFANLPEYAFPRLRALLDGHAPGGAPLAMSIGEPTHPTASDLPQVLAGATAGFGVYPPNEGSAALLAAISGWIARRYGVDLGADRLMALNGTREGLFNALLATCPERKNGARPVVLIPNPFYQVYAVAALAVGAEPVYLPATAATGHLPDFDALEPALLDRTAAVYLCSPANPQGAVASRDYLAGLCRLAERHDFRILADECYSEVWYDSPPPGMLEVASRTGVDPERILVFNSLSKRSNVPGLRAGFVAGGAGAIAAIRRLRAYAGAPMPLPLQTVAAHLWNDEDHVDASRALYVAKMARARAILGDLQGVSMPAAGFFLWLPVADGEEAALKLWRAAGVRVLPGAYLARTVGDDNPGRGHIRVALVAGIDDIDRGLRAIRQHLYD